MYALLLGCAWSAESPEPDPGAERVPEPCNQRPGHGPEMIVIEAGRFLMGSQESDPEAVSDERPQHEVTVAHPFAIARCETSVGAFRAFVEATGYKTDAERGGGCFVLNQAGNEFEQSKTGDWRNPGFRQTDAHPVVCISWNDARAYADWLSEHTGARYRLPTEAEWELAARAGTNTTRFWGDEGSEQCRFANGADLSLKRRFPERPWPVADCDDGQVFTAPTGSFLPNAYGQHDVLGNAWEWVQDCWHDTYDGAPDDGSAWESGDCARRVVRGGGWLDRPELVRSAFRFWYFPDEAFYDAGFRLARAL